jgi:hypothetical protein
MTEVTHIRLVAFTKKFHDELLSMGFVKKEKNKSSIVFTKNKVRNKMVISTMSGMTLSYKLNYNWVTVYNGLTVNLDLLKFFSEKDPLTIK